MRAFAVLLIAVFVACAFAQTPSTPVWPKYFSSSIFVESSHGNTSFFRWFYSEDEDKSRFDGMGERDGQNFYMQRIFDHSSEVEYTVIFQRNAEVCFYGKINGTVPVPDTSKLSYLGQSIINFSPVYVWTYTDTTTQITYHYLDNQSTREPVRVDFYDNARRFGESWTFFEFDEAEQDPNLFVLSQQIVNTCNQWP